MSEALGKMCKSMKKTLTASEKLSKPYVSDAQRGKFHAMEDRGEISHATVKEWDKASKGKNLPEHVSKAELEKFDQELAKSWGKAEGAPAPASMPAPPKPKMNTPKAPALKAPGGAKAPSMKAPAMKAPAMKMPKMEMMEKGVKLNMPLGPKGSGAGSITVSDDANKKKNSSVSMVSTAAPAPAMMKDDKPHEPGSPEERSHAVKEQGASFPKAMADMNRKGHEATHRFLNHLRSLKDPRRLRSPGNVMKNDNPQAAAEARIKLPADKTHEAHWEKAKSMGLTQPHEKASDYTYGALKSKVESKSKSPEVKKSEDAPGKKFVTVSQHWASGIHDKASGKYANPVKDAGKSRPEHMDDLHSLKAKGHISGWKEHDKPVKHWGEETYEKHPDGKLKFVHADYDTSD